MHASHEALTLADPAREVRVFKVAWWVEGEGEILALLCCQETLYFAHNEDSNHHTMSMKNK